ncbi:cytochrome P450 [Roseibium sp. RKSG952]|uniref:cytochrome P450 n=1 Tax=Roseibium sp. RKSG952 TaxID=2529384 RepID=UPI0018AD2427|nr:cytochrome P450 [Roseibium sp. RKSG952]
MDVPALPERDKTLSDHEFLKLARQLGPVARDRYGILVSFSHAHLVQLLNPDLTRQMETETLAIQGISQGPLFDFFNNALLFSNGAVHQRRRAPLARTFAVPLMKKLRPVIRRLAEDLIDEAIGQGPVDLRDTIAGPLAARAISGILGVPFEHLETLTEQVYSAVRALSVRSPDVIAEAALDMQALTKEVMELIHARSAAPRDDFISEFVATTNGRLTDMEIRIQLVTLLIAGSDTTRGALTSTLSQLMIHRGQWELLCADPEGLKQGAALEGLRYDPIIGALIRVAARDFSFEGVRVPKGTLIGPLVLTALRDPDVFQDPDRFDITRQDHPRWHPVFGGGEHRCLGEALARLELEEALAALATKAPGMQLAGPPATLRGLGGVRGVSPLFVQLTEHSSDLPPARKPAARHRSVGAFPA